jgi:hypothetical protein
MFQFFPVSVRKATPALLKPGCFCPCARLEQHEIQRKLLGAETMQKVCRLREIATGFYWFPRDCLVAVNYL